MALLYVYVRVYVCMYVYDGDHTCAYMLIETKIPASFVFVECKIMRRIYSYFYTQIVREYTDEKVNSFANHGNQLKEAYTVLTPTCSIKPHTQSLDQIYIDSYGW